MADTTIRQKNMKITANLHPNGYWFVLPAVLTICLTAGFAPNADSVSAPPKGTVSIAVQSLPPKQNSVPRAARLLRERDRSLDVTILDVHPQDTGLFAALGLRGRDGECKSSGERRQR